MGQHLGLVGSWAGWSCLRYHVRNVACVTGYHFSSFLPRVLLCRERLSQPVFMHNACHFICIHFVVMLFGSRPTSQFALVSFSFVHSFLSVTIQRREKIIAFLWVLVQCLLYFVTYRPHRKNISTSTVWSVSIVHSFQCDLEPTRQSQKLSHVVC